MAYPVVPASACAPGAIPTPSSLSSIEILALEAYPVFNYSAIVPATQNPNHPDLTTTGVDFCNVTITYTHPGTDDRVGVETWLPLDAWNGRLEAVGGSGWAPGRSPMLYPTMAAALGEGYATTSTDSGLGVGNAGGSWALRKEGVVNYDLVNDFMYLSFGDQAVLVKELIGGFYGQRPEYSYFSGCSQGGRQGLELAQRYPDAYDGIAAASPAIHLPVLMSSMIWAHVVMNNLGQFPRPCDFDYITSQAVAACDPLDGITDGLIAYGTDCAFDPFVHVGDEFTCASTNSKTKLSEAAAIIANDTWTGPRSPSGGFIWYGSGVDSSISGTDSAYGVGFAQTVCTDDGVCSPKLVGLGEDWFEYFVAKNSSWSWKELTLETFAEYAAASAAEYSAVANTANPDLAAFRAAGGKLITFHGTADELVPLPSTVDYYDAVLKADPAAHDFYRFFPVAGLGHCTGGRGGQPTGVWAALTKWVEGSEAPESLQVKATDLDGNERGRKLCPYPQRPALKPGASPDTVDAEDWECNEKSSL